MNFLQIVQMACRESMVVQPDSPDTVVGQSGLLNNFVNWTADSWDTLQGTRPRWGWMRKTVTGTPLTVGIGRYTAAALGISSFGSWIEDYTDNQGDPYFPVSIYQTSQGVAYEGPLPFMRWEPFRSTYLRGSVANNIPSAWSIDPSTREILFGPAPSVAITPVLEYVKGKQTRLAADGDVPELPTEHHPLLAYLALLRGMKTDTMEAGAIANAQDYVRDHMRILDREENGFYSVGGDPIA